MNGIENVSRRGFLQGVFSASALVLSVPLSLKLSLAQSEKGDLGAGSPADRATLHANVFVGVETDGTVHIMAGRAEMGTGIATSLPRVLADELDADWQRVRFTWRRPTHDTVTKIQTGHIRCDRSSIRCVRPELRCGKC